MIGTNRPSHQWFPASLALSLLAACGGGGGGSPPGPSGPQIVSAAFVGATATPQSGDTLVLAFASDVTLVAATLLNDLDLTLSDDRTLGDVTTPPSQLGPRIVSIPLGTGVDLVPGTTTVAMATTNDAVRDDRNRLGGRGNPVTIGSSDGAPPNLTRITLAGVDDELNGAGPAGGLLQVPPNGWTIDLAYNDNTGVATAATRIAANVAVTTTAGNQPAGTNLVPFLTALSTGTAQASYRVPASMVFPSSDCTLTATVFDGSGLSSTPRSFNCRVRTFSNSLRPFETTVNPSQVWFLDFTRDIESLSTRNITGGVAVDVTAGANSRSDFEDVLHVLGLQTGSPLPNVSGSLDSNQVVQALFKAVMLEVLDELFAQANITFTLTQPAGSFGSNFNLPYNSIGYSQISVAGASNITGVLGVAIFDPNNAFQNDNTRTNFQSTRLGIFLHTIANVGMGPPSTSLFRTTFGPLAPSLGGTAIGANTQDGQRLMGTLQDSRAGQLLAAIEDLARFAAVVLAHECGHSMGLVQNGAMPLGLYGNDETNFPGSTDGHIRNTSLFPAGAMNVMTPAISYTAALNPATAFNTLNLAYLREQVFYGN
jgi:hypothetical protein